MTILRHLLNINGLCVTLLAIEIVIPTEESLLKQENITLPQATSTVFGTMTPTFQVPRYVILKQINKEGMVPFIVYDTFILQIKGCSQCIHISHTINDKVSRLKSFVICWVYQVHVSREKFHSFVVHHHLSRFTVF